MSHLPKKFKVGDEVRILGDKAGAGHGFQEGAVGTISDIEWSPDETGQWEYQITVQAWDDYWVAESDLELVVPSMSDYEMEKAIEEAFGVKLEPLRRKIYDVETIEHTIKMLEQWASPPRQVITWLHSFADSEREALQQAKAAP